MPSFTIKDLEELEGALVDNKFGWQHDLIKAFPRIAEELRRLWALEESFKTKSKKINHQRKILFVSQLGICHYCGKKVEYYYFNVDHKLAQANGGTDDADNLVGACLDCNHEKASQDYETFKRKKTSLLTH